MTYTIRSAAQAVDVANATTTWTTKMCLQFVYHCLAEPNSGGVLDANAAWDAATQKVTTGTPPAGAPVYFKGFTHGHIALSLGGGKIRSTDWPTPGLVGTTTIGDLCRDWYGSQANYLGWSRDYCGQTIRGLEATSTVNSGTPPPITTTQEDLPMAIADDILAEIRGLRAEEAGRYKVYSDRFAEEQGDLGRIEQGVNGLRSEESGRYSFYASKFNGILDAIAGAPDDADMTAVQSKLDALKAAVAALPKA